MRSGGAMEERRLLIVVDSLPGGLGQAARAHQAWFLDHGWHVDVAAPPHQLGVDIPGLIPIALPSTVLDIKGLAGAAQTLRDLRRRLRPSVVHCHGARSFVATRLSGWQAPFVTLHWIGRVASDPPGYGLLRGPGLSAVSLFAARAFSVFPECPRGWRFVPFASARLPALEQLGSPRASEPTMLWVGRLDEPKRPDQFVDAMAQLAQSVPGVRGLMAGSGPLEEAVSGQIERLGAPVSLLGQIADLTPYLEQAWAVVVLAGSEGLPFALQEAMWVGRPFVASDLPGARWLVGDDARVGTLVHDTDGATVAMARFCSHDTAVAAGKAAAQRIRGLLDPYDPWPAMERAYLA
ncbi:MAG: glycosyltransferase [Acidimicrobiales bacterium]